MKANERLPTLADPDRSVRPVWGHVVRMLTHGYDWKGEPGHVPDRWAAKRVWVVEYDERVRYDEPDPRVSNKSTTGTRIYMTLADWSPEQIDHELSLLANVSDSRKRESPARWLRT